MNTNTEIATACERAKAMLNTEDLGTAISDAIADLLILAHEKDSDLLGTVITRGIAHFAATYIEPMDDQDAEDWLHDELFPLTGERQFAAYAADQAITLAGKDGRVDAPEWI
jgi:hypothetical protein